VNTLAAIVPTPGLADTVTPPIVSPDEETTVPLRITSSARPFATASTVVATANAATAMNCRGVMTFLPSLLASGIGLRRRYRLQISDNRICLVPAHILFAARP